MRPVPWQEVTRTDKIAPMSPREVVQSESMKGRRSFDGALIGFILAVATALALGGSGVFN